MNTNGGPRRDGMRNELFRRTMDRAGELAAARRRRQRLLVTTPAVVLALVLTVGAVAAAVTASGRGNGTGRRHLGAGQSTTSPSSTPGPTTTITQGGGSVIRNFDPLSFTAVSLEHWWVLGYVPCNGSHCFTILETLDGGSRFSRVPVPAGLAPDTNGTVEIRFANSNDGYVVGSHLFATTDGGQHWLNQSLAGSVTDVEASGGQAYAVACGSRHCSLFEEAVGSAGAWHAASLPERLSSVAFLSVAGGRVVVTSGVGSSKPVHFLLSSDRGTTFTAKTSPCFPGLGGHVFVAVSQSSALWAACPTGMLATPFRSSDNGSKWSVADSGSPGTSFSNGQSIAPLSASTAVLWPFNSGGGLALTTNGGTTYTSVLDRGNGALAIWAGYSDAQRAYVIFSTGPYAGELWVSSDGGRGWQEVRFVR